MGQVSVVTLIIDAVRTIGAALLISVLLSCSGNEPADGSDACAPSPDSSFGTPRPDCPNDLPDDTDCPTASPFYEEVAPIIERRCTVCHQPGGLESMLLFRSYDEAYRLRREMLFQIYSCRMPPSCAPNLTFEERKTVLKWFVCGAPATADAGSADAGSADAGSAEAGTD
jgi:hypothetical protein